MGCKGGLTAVHFVIHACSCHQSFCQFCDVNGLFAGLNNLKLKCLNAGKGACCSFEGFFPPKDSPK